METQDAGKESERKRTRKLTHKEKDFAKLLPIVNNGTKAAKLAGYSPKTAALSASRNIRKDHVQDAIKASMRSIGFDETYISDRLKVITEAGTSDKALKQASVKDANKSLELGARLYGLMGSNNTSQTLIVKAELQGKTSEELKEELKKLRAEEDKFLNP